MVVVVVVGTGEEGGCRWGCYAVRLLAGQPSEHVEGGGGGHCGQIGVTAGRVVLHTLLPPSSRPPPRPPTPPPTPCMHAALPSCSPQHGRPLRLAPSVTDGVSSSLLACCGLQVRAKELGERWEKPPKQQQQQLQQQPKAEHDANGWGSSGSGRGREAPQQCRSGSREADEAEARGGRQEGAPLKHREQREGGDRGRDQGGRGRQANGERCDEERGRGEEEGRGGREGDGRSKRKERGEVGPRLPAGAVMPMTHTRASRTCAQHTRAPITTPNRILAALQPASTAGQSGTGSAARACGMGLCRPVKLPSFPAAVLTLQLPCRADTASTLQAAALQVPCLLQLPCKLLQARSGQPALSPASAPLATTIAAPAPAMLLAAGSLLPTQAHTHTRRASCST